MEHERKDELWFCLARGNALTENSKMKLAFGPVAEPNPGPRIDRQRPQSKQLAEP
jgi:hypothetical protein